MRIAPTSRPQIHTARKRMRAEGGGYRRDYLRALAQRAELDAEELRIMGSKSELLRTLVAAQAQTRRLWRAQFCTEVARPTRFERVASTFGAWRSIS